MRKVLLTTFVCLSIIVKGQNLQLYGETSAGGAYFDGTLFSLDLTTAKDSVLHSFNGTDGSSPVRRLLLASNGLLYSAAFSGGSSSAGLLFSYDILTGQENSLMNFNISNGRSPGGALIQLSNGLIYGGTGYGGVYNSGVIFSYDPALSQYTVLHNFNDTDGRTIYGGLLPVNDSLLYGITEQGGTFNYGTIFFYNIKSNKESTAFDFDGTNGGDSQSSFILAKDGLLYAMTESGGSHNNGVLFSFDPVTLQEKVLLNFDSTTNGAEPFGDLLQPKDGYLYGLASSGGVNNGGVLFRFDPTTGKDTVLIPFASLHNASYPTDRVIEDTTTGTLYGMTASGGLHGLGIIFSYNIKTGKDSVLLDFNNTNGATPLGSLLLVNNDITGLNKLVKVDSIIIYPNPTKGVFTIQTHGEEKTSELEIYNMLGEEIYNKELKCRKETVDLKNNPEGVYFYRVMDISKNITSIGKILIDK